MPFRKTSADLVGAAAIACMVTQPLYAATWLSSVTIIDNGTQQATTRNQQVGTTYAGTRSTTAVFNLSISLEENPQGDDAYPEEPANAADDDAQNAYERRIEEFADAVFQMTNGAHKIGTVTVFRDGDQANNTDVQ